MSKNSYCGYFYSMTNYKHVYSNAISHEDIYSTIQSQEEPWDWFLACCLNPVSINNSTL